MSSQTQSSAVRLHVKNVGGIDECTVDLSPGVTVFAGRNATNRTSLLSALGDVLGGSGGRLKSDADEGEVHLEFDGQRFTRTYHRTENGVTVDGTPFSPRSEYIDLFVTLLENNPARRAIERNDDLRDVIMRPTDTQEIREQIHELSGERNQVEDRLRELRDQRARLPELEEELEEVERQRVEIDDEIESVQDRIHSLTEDLEQPGSTEEREKFERLRNRLTNRQSQLTTTRETLQALRNRRDTVEAKLEEVSERQQTQTSVADKLERTRRRERQLSERLETVLSVLELNEAVLLEQATPSPGSIPGGSGPAPSLDPDQEIVNCWTCGHEVSKSEIEERIDEFRSVIADLREERRSVEEQIETLEERRQELQGLETKQRDLEHELQDIDSEIARRESELQEHEDILEEIREDLATAQSELEMSKDMADEDLLELYERLGELEHQRGGLTQQIQALTEDIEKLRSTEETIERLKARRDRISTEMSDLRTRVRELEENAVTAFNTRMADLIDLLEYHNIERVWIERRGRSEGGFDEGGSADTTFELHIVRSNDSGSMYEDTVETLSESERELIGLVVALSGNLVHEVHNDVPFILLDSLEAIDAERIERILEYFADHTEYLVAALLPEDADAVHGIDQRISASGL